MIVREKEQENGFTIWVLATPFASLSLEKTKSSSDHFHEDCIKEDLRAKYMGHKPTVHLKEGAIPTIFGYRVYDEINMDGTTVLSRSTLTKRSQKREHRQVCSMCLLLE